MYQSPNTHVLFKVIGASSIVLLAIFVVFGFLIPKKVPTVVNPPVISVIKTSVETPKEQKILEKKYVVEQKTNPIILIRDKNFDAKYRYEVVDQRGLPSLNFYDHSGIPLVSVTRVPSIKEMNRVVLDSYAVGSESIVTIGGIAYVRQEIISLEGNAVSMRTIPGNNCKKDSACPLLVTQLQQNITPEYLAMYEEIVSRITFIESGEGLVKFASVFPHDKKITFNAIPGAYKKETADGIEILVQDEVIARITTATKPKKTNNETKFTIGEQVFIVYTTDESAYYTTMNTTTYKIEIFRDDGLISALSLR